MGSLASWQMPLLGGVGGAVAGSPNAALVIYFRHQLGQFWGLFWTQASVVGSASHQGPTFPRVSLVASEQSLPAPRRAGLESGKGEDKPTH